LVRPGAGCKSPDRIHFKSRRRPSGPVGFIRRSVGRNTLACEIFTSR